MSMLIRSGTTAPPRDRIVEASFEACHRLARATAGNFYYSFLTLPRHEFRGMCALYAFLRITDDIGDQHASPEVRERQLAEWEQTLMAAISGERVVAGDAMNWRTTPASNLRNEVIPAVAALVQRGELPLAPLCDVIRGVRLDLLTVDIPNEVELRNYCYHVAGAVGLACIHLWGCRSEEAREPAIACGEAFQRTNILRDVREDALLGRFYIPRESCDRFDCTRSDLALGQGRERLVGLLVDQLARAHACYRQAEELFDLLPVRGQPILSAMIGIYRGLFDRIAADPLVVYRRRVSLPVWRKLWCAGQALVWKRSVRRTKSDPGSSAVAVGFTSHGQG
jgi:phytoene synthase